MKKILAVIALLIVSGCVQPPKMPTNPLEQIEASEVLAQQISASATSLTCTKFLNKKCVEPGKALSPDQGLKIHDSVQDARKALRTAASIKSGELGDCLGEKRSQNACIAAARLLLNKLEQQVLQAQAQGGGR